jgi:hypothetical protein
LYINDDDSRDWNGLLIDDHIACAALEMLNDLAPKIDNKYDITQFDMSKYKYPQKRLRIKCYNIALTAYTHETETDLTRKLTKKI